MHPNMDMERGDVLVVILRHLPPRSLAASRCVCAAWRAVIDDHRLLRADLLPLSLHAVIFETDDPDDASPTLFSPRSSSTARTMLDYLDTESPVHEKKRCWPMLDHCNGLLLLAAHIVVNPATRQWAKLPPPPPRPPLCTATTGCRSCTSNPYIVYDPTVSPEYQVLLIPRIPRLNTHCHQLVSAMEWPPSPYIIDVFSSKTGCWGKRSFTREGDAAGVVADLYIPRMLETYLYYSAYWHEALYVCCQHAFLLRINLSNDKYQVIKLPRGNKGARRLGKSKNGVYCALLHGGCICEVWFLDESRGQMVWVLKNQINLQPAETKYPLVDGPWVMQSHDDMEWNLSAIDDNAEALVKDDDFEWNSENEDVVSTADWPREYCGYIACAPVFRCLGFHPYKEIIFFHDGSNTTVAYYLNSSKVQYLGMMEAWSEAIGVQEIAVSFAYAPCWRRDLPGSN